MAQAILLADVEGLGENGTAVEVSSGYLRNYLQPRGLAQPATPGALEEAIRRKEAAEKAEREALARAAESASLLSKTVLTIQHRAGEDGKLYGSVTTKEIAEAIRDARGIKVDKRKIRLDVPIHQVGTYMIDVEVAGGATASVKTIVAEEK
jgi:large subunit ribosomal protein L9